MRDEYDQMDFPLDDNWIVHGAIDKPVGRLERHIKESFLYSLLSL